MATRSIVTYQPDIECDVCGRRLLRGERPDVFLAAGHERTVCELCMPRAAQEGWRRASEVSEMGIGGERQRRGISLIGRLRQLRAGESRRRPLEERDGDAGAPLYDREDDLSRLDPIDGIGAASEAAQAAGAVLGGLDEPSRSLGFAPQPAPAWPASAGGESEDESEREGVDDGDPLAEPTMDHRIPAAQQRHVEQPTDSHLPAPADLERLQAALEIFNASEYPQRVAGISRSLGEPSVTVRPLQDGSGTVAILLAWELAWYRYGVDPAAPEGTVRLLADGTALHELAEDDRMANALASDRGEVSLLL